MLILANISWQIQRMIINGFWVDHLGLMWVILGQICCQGVTKISWDLPNFNKPKSYQMSSKEPINSMLILANISWHMQRKIIIGFGLLIWGRCESFWVRFVVRVWQKSAEICPTSISQNTARCHSNNQSTPCLSLPRTLNKYRGW
jgi:hypothetical protein